MTQDSHNGSVLQAESSAKPRRFFIFREREYRQGDFIAKGYGVLQGFDSSADFLLDHLRTRRLNDVAFYALISFRESKHAVPVSRNEPLARAGWLVA